MQSPSIYSVLRSHSGKQDLTPSLPAKQNALFFLRWTMSFATPVVLTIVLLISGVFAQDRSHARSMVITRYGIVAASHVQASQVGAQILARGGSAVDAAIAANAVLGVTEPMMNGIGGDLFALYWDAKIGKLYGLNASGWAPQSLTIEHQHSAEPCPPMIWRSSRRSGWTRSPPPIA